VARRPSHPPLSGEARADVAVVGGGLAGLSAALELAQRGRSVVVLESQRVGWAASGRNGGQALPGLACDMAEIESQLGLGGRAASGP
jgi:gamma-glutamylputrescine oxidase